MKSTIPLTPEEQAQRERRWANRNLNTVQVLERLRADQPEAHALAEVVGTWVWITFPAKPSEQVREFLSDLGFIWNRARGAWQHCCGRYTHHSPGDPRLKYGSVAAEELAAA